MSHRTLYVRTLVLLFVGSMLIKCASNESTGGNKELFSAKEEGLSIGGQPVITLSRPQSKDQNLPQILSVEVLPGRGMNIYQLKAYLPGKGVINLMESPSLEEAKKRMEGGPDDFKGNQSFRVGGAILVPYANRLRGKFLPEEKAIQTTILGKEVKLPANWKGKNPGAEWHAMHGLILDLPMDKVTTDAGPREANAIGTLDAGDFQGHWLSRTNLTIKATLNQDTFGFNVDARNSGNEPLPMGIGWHPYFVFPSGNRRQAKLVIPAGERALVDNYDNVFPTGKLVPLKGTPYDFSVPGGAPLGEHFLDDCFVNLQKNAGGQSVAEIIDPAAKYGIRIRSLSPEISAIQVYAPVDKSFVALEPQFNWADPFSPLWGGKVNTGMVTLQPGQTVTYSVQLELFVP
jgi:aldose 1-epimerase